MRLTRITWLAALVAVMALALSGTAASAKSGGCPTMRANLAGGAAFPAVNGKAVFKRCSATNRELQVEIEDAKPLAGRTLSVFVNGTKAGTMHVGALGRARLNLDSQRGDTVPAVVQGSPVRVRTAAGALVASGTF
jgi:hypothetical protein